MTFEHDLSTVLPSFRTTRRDLWRWGAVNEYAYEAAQGVRLLGELADEYGAGRVIPAVQKAVASTFRVLMRADDSGGGIQLVIADLLTLHAELCAEDPPTPSVLSTWIQKQQFGEVGEYFDIDVTEYEEALGAKGIAIFERQLEKRRVALTTPFDGRPELEYSGDGERSARHSLLFNLQRLAVLHGDEEAIVRTHGGDLPRSHLRVGASNALREAGFMKRAATIAHEGMDLPGGDHQQKACGELWVEIVSAVEPSEAAHAAEIVFERWPSAHNAQNWTDAAGSGVRERAITGMRARSSELVAFLLQDGDVARAWSEALAAAERDARLHPSQWDDLIDQYATIDPIAVLPVMAQLIDDRLIEANTRVYPGAVKRMRQLRKAASDAGRPELAAAYLAEFRAKNARRPSLIQRMDAAGL